MKSNIKSMVAVSLLLLSLGLFMSGCVEHRYYHEHHQHSPEYYHRHHRNPPPGVDIEIHN